jgi:hypothetical protein
VVSCSHMQKFDWKNLYFVFATLLGLVLMVIGVVTATNTILTTYVFPVKSYPQGRPMDPPTMAVSETKKLQESGELTESQKEALAQWEKDYARWQETEAKYDYEAENRKRSIANAIAMILAGVPVFALHAPFVFRTEKSSKK